LPFTFLLLLLCIDRVIKKTFFLFGRFFFFLAIFFKTETEMVEIWFAVNTNNIKAMHKRVANFKKY